MGRKQRGQSPRQKKVWVELKKHDRDRTNFAERLRQGKYEPLDYDLLMTNDADGLSIAESAYNRFGTPEQKAYIADRKARGFTYPTSGINRRNQ